MNDVMSIRFPSRDEAVEALAEQPSNHYARSEEIKRELVKSLVGRTILAIRFVDSLGGEDIVLSFEDGRILCLSSMEWIEAEMF